MTKIKVKKNRLSRISQGDVFRDVECIEYFQEKKGVMEISKILFPLVVILTQDCDLEQNAKYLNKKQCPSNQDKKLFSVLVVPLYNSEHVFSGEHLGDLGHKMSSINKKRTEGISLMQN